MSAKNISIEHYVSYDENNKLKLLDGWLRMGLLPPLGNFADISYLVEN